MEPGLPDLLEKLYADRGWDFRGYKKTSLTRRITRRVHASSASSLDEYMALLESDPSEYHRLFSGMTVKVSEFFREPEVFAAISDILRGEMSSTPVRAWSCGCAFGEEAYSLAILLSECLGIDALASSRVFATDIDPEALDAARRGAYRADSVENVPVEYLDRYFISQDGQHRVRGWMRNLVKFGTMDIVRSTPLSGMNLVLCRNLFIYFEKDLQEAVFSKLDYALRPGGVLALGKAEVMPHRYAARYEPVGCGLNLYRKR